jgi:hypothetical protein
VARPPLEGVLGWNDDFWAGATGAQKIKLKAGAIFLLFFL